jgi:hypothetical protein
MNAMKKQHAVSQVTGGRRAVFLIGRYRVRNLRRGRFRRIKKRFCIVNSGEHALPGGNN